MKKISLSLVTFFLISAPFYTYAAFDGIRTMLNSLQGIVNIAIPLAFACALLFFFYGVAKFLFRLGGDVGAVEEGKQMMIWGLIALFVIASVWGIISFAQGELGITKSATPPGTGSGGGTITCDPINGERC